MAIGIYIHIPYCIKRCWYCDFSTYEYKKAIINPSKYIDLIKEEIRLRNNGIEDKHVKSIYFGGGTPSLIDPQLIYSALQCLLTFDFVWDQDTEITIEMNPTTIESKKIDDYINIGINRFSLGVKTFNDELLKRIGRANSSQKNIIKAINILQSNEVVYSIDLLFALPGQSIKDLKDDLNFIAKYNPPHVSAYCLTLKQNHRLLQNRPSEDEEIEMFHVIERYLKTINLERYEISNFAIKGYESTHNLIYW